MPHKLQKHWRMDGTPILVCSECKHTLELSSEEWMEREETES